MLSKKLIDLQNFNLTYLLTVSRTALSQKIDADLKC